MKRNEKNLQTRRRIIDSALLEFGEKSYAEASINSICALGNISKGIIYHYFKDKDELYLVCVGECFDTLTEYLAWVVTLDSASVETALEIYFEARIIFFSEHPLYLRLFCNTMSSPPAHLSSEIADRMARFDALNISVLTGILKRVRLRPGVTVAEVVEVFREYQDFVNARFQMRFSEQGSLREHERRCSRSLDILLYGVIERSVCA